MHRILEYVISDTHFGEISLFHNKLREENTDKKIWNNLFKLPKGSILYHLGDLSRRVSSIQKNITKLIQNYNIKVIMIKGNHDKETRTAYMKLGLICVNRIDIKAWGYNITLSHKPISGEFDINFHGHFHNIGYKTINCIEPDLVALLDDRHHLISIEDLKYQPILLESLANYKRQNKLIPTLQTIQREDRINRSDQYLHKFKDKHKTLL